MRKRVAGNIDDPFINGDSVMWPSPYYLRPPIMAVFFRKARGARAFYKTGRQNLEFWLLRFFSVLSVSSMASLPLQALRQEFSEFS
jgi:hypothetical protein